MRRPTPQFGSIHLGTVRIKLVPRVLWRADDEARNIPTNYSRYQRCIMLSSCFSQHDLDRGNRNPGPRNDFTGSSQGQTSRRKGHPIDHSHRPPRSTEHLKSRAGRLLTVDTTTRRSTPAVFLIVMLFFAVFFWGLQYKLSLYHFGTGLAAGPAAKLLSPKERPMSSKDVSSVGPASLRPHVSTLFATLLIAGTAFGSSLVRSYSIWTVITDVDCRQRSRVRLSCFSSRPPPAAFVLG